MDLISKDGELNKIFINGNTTHKNKRWNNL